MEESFENNPEENNGNEHIESIKSISGHFEDWFLDYASYVILERAVPAIEDGLKPVHRRILHSMKEMDDGRYHKVANIIGHTMKYHPHGDTSIGDALVHIGQKDLLIDTQGNWGNIFTGDRAAASRYIEARLTPFALETLYNPKITEWLSSYDGRGKEPRCLPSKFPMLLYHGVEGIAVGLSTKIMPHNFNELLDASVSILKNRSFRLYPDFPTGGIADFSNYNDGAKGGKIRLRARIEKLDKKTLKISEIPFTSTTSSLIDSILKANDKGKIKIKKIEDNTAEFVEILVYLPPNISPDQMIDALYAFTDCEVNISVYACVIQDERPMFIGVSDILKYNTHHTVQLLTDELTIKLNEAKEQWHLSSLEKIFIENRIYLRIEDCETWEAVLDEIRIGLEPFTAHLQREVTEEDIVRLTEIKIKRISKFDAFKADENILKIEGKIAEYQDNLDNIIDYTINFFKDIKKKYGVDRQRKTEISSFGNIVATRVAIANEKLYVDRKEGFVGIGLKKEEFVSECSDIDDIIVIRKNGSMMVSRVEDKKFFGKDIIHVAVWKKGNKRKIYNLIYSDGATGFSYKKRFYVQAITRDKEYFLGSEHAKSKINYLTVNPNGEAEKVAISIKPQAKTKKVKFELDFGELGVKGRSSKGNLVAKFPIKEITLKEKGVSTLDPIKIWLDETIMRLNREERGRLLGEFAAEDMVLQITNDGNYQLLGYDITTHFNTNWLKIEHCDFKRPISVVYYYPERGKYYVKRFLVEKTDKLTSMLPDETCKLEFVSTDWKPNIRIHFKKPRGKEVPDPIDISLADFIDIKGLKTIGNQLSSGDIKDIEELEPSEYIEPVVEEEEEDTTSNSPSLFDEEE
jgi:topoisomerase-4 subunit A